MEALGKSQQKQQEKDHEIEDFFDHSDQHCDQEVELSEHPDQVYHLRQSKHYAEGYHHSPEVWEFVVQYIQESTSLVEDIPWQLEVIPWVKEVPSTIILHLDELIEEK